MPVRRHSLLLSAIAVRRGRIAQVAAKVERPADATDAVRGNVTMGARALKIYSNNTPNLGYFTLEEMQAIVAAANYDTYAELRRGDGVVLVALASRKESIVLAIIRLRTRSNAAVAYHLTRSACVTAYASFLTGIPVGTLLGWWNW